MSAAPSAPLTHATASALALPLHYERASGVIVDANDGNVAVVCRHKDQKAIEAGYALVVAANRAPAYDAMLAALYECEAYLTDREDVVDGSYGEPAPNREMSLLIEVSAAIKAAEGVKP